MNNNKGLYFTIARFTKSNGEIIDVALEMQPIKRTDEDFKNYGNSKIDYLDALLKLKRVINVVDLEGRNRKLYSKSVVYINIISAELPMPKEEREEMPREDKKFRVIEFNYL